MKCDGYEQCITEAGCMRYCVETDVKRDYIFSKQHFLFKHFQR